MSLKRYSWRLAASTEQQMCWSNSVVDNTDGRTDGVVGRAADGRWRPASVVVAIKTRTECGERIVHQTALGSVTVWRTAQQIDSTVFVSRITHSTHCTNSELGVSPRLTALSIFIQQRLTWKVSRNRAPRLNTSTVTWLLVIQQQTGENRSTRPETG